MRLKEIFIQQTNQMFIVKCTIIIIFLISFGCTKKEITKENVIKIELPDKWEDKFLVDNSKIIKLETKNDILLGFLMDIKISNDTIYVLDQFFKRIYLFDMNGKYKGKIDNLGKGTNEYLRIKDFTIYKNEIYLLADKKIIIFNKSNLQAKREIKLDFYSYSVMVGKKNMILSTNNFSSGYFLNYLSKENMKITRFLQSEIKSGDTKTELIYAGYNFHSIPNENKSIFHFTFSDYIYTVSDSGYQCTYQVDLKDKGIPKNKLIKSPQLIKDCIEHERHLWIYNTYQIGNTLAIYLNSNLENNIGGKAFLIKTKNRTSFYHSVIEKSLGFSLRIVGTSPNGFVGFVPFDVMEKRKNELNEKRQNGEELSFQEKKFLAEFDENSNPYLVIFNFDE